MKDIRERETVAFGESWVCATGWPLRALAYEVVRDSQTSTETLLYGFTIPDAGSWSDGFPGGVARALGYRPLSVGLFVDALFYGILWFGLIVGFAAARRGLRKKRGRCPMCGYDLRGIPDAGCPECGWGRGD